MYRETTLKIKEISDTIHYSWFKKFYGDANLEHFHIILSYLSLRHRHDDAPTLWHSENDTVRISGSGL